MLKKSEGRHDGGCAEWPGGVNEAALRNAGKVEEWPQRVLTTAGI